MKLKRNRIPVVVIIGILFAAVIYMALSPAIGDPADPDTSGRTDPSDASDIAEVPVLMYHHISDDVTSSAVVTAETFEEHMATLREEGYTAVSLKELSDFVYGAGELPEKPVVITFDDGYMSNYELAFPILKKYEMKASIFVIGSSVGKSEYKDTGKPIIPHFGYEEANEMIASGLIEIQSHSYDMHQSAGLENGPVRTSVARLEGESDKEYEEALRGDMSRSISEIEDATGEECFAFSYPLGVYNQKSESVLHELGIKITFTTEPRLNTVKRGDPGSLLLLDRFVWAGPEEQVPWPG